MLRYIVMVVMVSASALTAVEFLNRNPDVVDTAATVARDTLDARRARTEAQQPVRVYSGTERLRADPRGHYLAQFNFNSRPITGVVDTGATMIAMNASVARRIGITVRPNEFIYNVNTANGTVKAARAIVDEVRLGSIRVNNVEAMVLEDDSLNIVLIGMSFLNRLRNFEFANGTLEMKL